MTCMLSITITALVRLPWEASTRRLFSRASCIMRFAGALSGEVMDIILPADIILPKPMFTSFTDILPLFYILYLFAYLLYLALACDNEIDYVAIVCLGADRVELTVHFLHYEVQLSA